MKTFLLESLTDEEPETDETLENILMDMLLHHAAGPVGQVEIQKHRYSYRDSDK